MENLSCLMTAFVPEGLGGTDTPINVFYNSSLPNLVSFHFPQGLILEVDRYQVVEGLQGSSRSDFLTIQYLEADTEAQGELLFMFVLEDEQMDMFLNAFVMEQFLDMTHALVPLGQEATAYDFDAELQALTGSN